MRLDGQTGGELPKSHMWMHTIINSERNEGVQLQREPS